MPRTIRLLLSAALAALAACADAGMAPELPGAPAALVVVSGDEQTGTPGAAAADPLRVRVVDRQGRAVTGALVRWGATGGTLSPALTTSNLAGVAETRLSFGPAAGTVRAAAFVAGADSIVFSHSVRPGAAAAFAQPTGQGQSATVGASLAQPLRTRVVDEFGNAVPGTAVSWQVLAGGGEIAPLGEASDSAAWVAAAWRLGTKSGAQSAAVYLSSGDSLVFTATASPGPLATLTLGPAAGAVEVGALLQMSASGRDAYDNAVSVAASGVSWSVSDTALAVIASNGRLRGRQPGTIEVAGVRQGIRATRLVTVTPSSVVSVALAPPDALLPVGDSIRLSASTRNAAGANLSGRWIEWSVDGSAGTLAFSAGAGAATLLAVDEGTVRVHAAVGDAVGTSVIEVRRPRHAVFGRIAAGSAGTCALTLDARAWCWGTIDSLQIVADEPGGVTAPEPLAGAPPFASLYLGTFHACALTAAGAAWCWGDGQSGRLGNDVTAASAVPVPVAGGHAFTSLAIGHDHTCGITTAGDALCWGLNVRGQLGDGGTTTSLRPVPVTGGLRFTTLSAAYQFTCGVTTAQALVCWGYNEVGQLGAGDAADRHVPTAPGAGRAWRTVTAGGAHACAATTTGDVFCWGNNTFNQLGDGTDTDRHTPVQLATPTPLVSLTSRGIHTCGLSDTGAAWCWGAGDAGQLGTGGTTPAATPAPVATALRFDRIAAGILHTCALTADGAAYCWGENAFGQVGDLTRTERLLPTPVLTYR